MKPNALRIIIAIMKRPAQRLVVVEVIRVARGSVVFMLFCLFGIIRNMNEN